MQVGSYIFGCMGPELSRNEIDFFSEAQPWGFITFSRNINNREQLYRLTSELRKSVGREAPTLIDQDGGILPVLKHIPGYGRAVVDGHETLPLVTEPYDTLSQTDFESFRQLSYLPMAMTAHISYTDIDVIPATISKKMLTLIREDIGFKNLIMTDDISMGALKGSLYELSRLSLEAGCDLVLHCNGGFSEMEEEVSAFGYLSDESLLRSEAVLLQRQRPKFIFIKELEEELSICLGVRK